MATASIPNPALKSYEDSVRAQVDRVTATLAECDAQAKHVNAQAAIATANTLNAAKDAIDRKLHDLKTTSDANVERAKADIDAAVATFKTSVDELRAKLKTDIATK